MTALDTFAATLAPGQFAQFPAPSLTTFYDGVAYPFEPSAAARADAAANGWSAVHMADWWSHLPWDEASDTYWIAGGRDRFKALAQNLVSYDAAANAWVHRPAWSGFGGGHCYQGTAAGGGKVYGYTINAPGGFSVWDVASGALAGTIPACPNNVCPPYTSTLAAGAAVAVLPWLGAQGSLLMVNTNGSSDLSKRLSRVARFDFAAQQWLPVFAQKGVWDNQHTIAIPSRHGSFAWIGASVAATPRPLGILDAAGAVSFIPAGPFNACTGGSSSSRGLVFEHPHRAELISFSIANGRIGSYALGDAAWVDRGPVPADLMNANSAAMPTRFGAAFVRYQSTGRSKMYAWVPGW